MAAINGSDQPDGVEQEARITQAMEPYITKLITQRGSRFSSSLKGPGIIQGNELEISSSQARRLCIQEGSEFGGSIQARDSVIQGNRVRV
jgi:hypothetical protein